MDENDRAAKGELPDDPRAGTAEVPPPVSIFQQYTLEHARADANKAGKGTSTGFAELEALDFRFNPGQLYAVAGRPGEGKTALMLDMLLRNVETRAADENDHQPSVFITYEVSRRDLFRRIVLREYGRATSYKNKLEPIAVHRWLRTGKSGEGPQVDDALAAAAARIDRYTRQGLLVIVDGDQEGSEAPLILRALEDAADSAGHPPALVVLDYYQKVKPDPTLRTNGSRQMQLQDVAERLRKYAKGEPQAGGKCRDDFAVPVLVGAQVNRETASARDAANEGKQPDLHHVREADDLANDAAGVLTVKMDEKQSTVFVQVVKNRDGSKGEPFPLAFHGWCCCFEGEADLRAQTVGFEAAKNRGRA